MTIYEKLAAARKNIRAAKTTKDGENTYSHYSYFTPEYVEKIVSDECEKQKMICLVSLRADEHGLYQELTLVNLEDLQDRLIFTLRTERGEMKATNVTQQMGGTDTYSERYIKMKVFTIKDNSLDPDSQDNRYPQRKVYSSKATTPDQFGYKEPKHRDVAKDDAENDAL